MTKTESRFETDIMKKIKEEFPNSWWTKIQQTSLRNLPDRIGCVNSTFVALEFKRTEALANRKTGSINAQKYVLGQIKEAKGLSYMVHPNNYKEIIEDIRLLCT